MDADVVDEHWPPNAPQDAEMDFAISQLTTQTLRYLRENATSDGARTHVELLEHAEYETSCDTQLRKTEEKNTAAFEIFIKIYTQTRSELHPLIPILSIVPTPTSAVIINRLHSDDRIVIANAAITEYLEEREKEIETRLCTDSAFDSDGDALVDDWHDPTGDASDVSEDGEELEDDVLPIDEYFALIEHEDRGLYNALREIHRRIIKGSLEEKTTAPVE